MDIKSLHHVAYRCKDAKQTAEFYTKVLGLEYAMAMAEDRVPSTGEETPYVHFFFELQDGSYIAFFDLGGDEMPQPSPNTPDWVQHFAIETASIENVQAMKDRLDAHGIETIGLVDHEFVRSVYFFDPNGLRLEITTRTEPPGFLEQAAAEAHDTLKAWNARKAAARATA